MTYAAFAHVCMSLDWIGLRDWNGWMEGSGLIERGVCLFIYW